MLCRAMKPLRKGEHIVPVGAVEYLNLSATALEMLLTKGAIVPAYAPPLSEIPMWENRAGQLLTIGILDAEQFLETDEKILIKHLDIEHVTLAAWKEELLRWLCDFNARGH